MPGPVAFATLQDRSAGELRTAAPASPRVWRFVRSYRDVAAPKP